MTHHNSGRDRIGFYLIMTRHMSFDARISSRITTGIRVVGEYQINYNWFNEPYAVSQYRAFILRHAWLNLWDKRMTTGRINQIAIHAFWTSLQGKTYPLSSHAFLQTSSEAHTCPTTYASRENTIGRQARNGVFSHIKVRTIAFYTMASKHAPVNTMLSKTPVKERPCRSYHAWIVDRSLFPMKRMPV